MVDLSMCKVLVSNLCIMEGRERGRREGMQGERGGDGRKKGGRVREVREKKGEERERERSKEWRG